MWNDLWLNVAANLIAAAILAVLGLSTLFVYFVLDRQKQLRFFGATSRNPHIRVFVSRLQIEPGGTTGFEPIDKGYFGPAINHIEYKAALLIREAFRSRMLARVPRRVQELLGSRSVALVDVDPVIDVSPQLEDEISSRDNLLLLGTSIYNLGSRRYFNHSSACFEYGKNDRGERVFRFRTRGMEGVEIPGRSKNRELGVIQRFCEPDRGRVVFLCAGLGAEATYGCTRYLIANWRELRRKCRNKEFAICLAFPGDSLAMVETSQPHVVYEHFGD